MSAAQKRAPLPKAWGVLYAHPNPDGSTKACHNCFLWIAPQNRCVIHAEDVPVPPAAVCGYHVFGMPAMERPHIPALEPVDPKTSGLEVVPEGTVCGSCRFFEPGQPGKGLCHGVAKADGRPPQPVEEMGCCARWERAE